MSQRFLVASDKKRTTRSSLALSLADRRMNSKLSQKSLNNRKYRQHLTNTPLSFPPKAKPKAQGKSQDQRRMTETRRPRPRPDAQDQDHTFKTKTAPFKTKTKTGTFKTETKTKTAFFRSRDQDRGLETTSLVLVSLWLGKQRKLKTHLFWLLYA